MASTKKLDEIIYTPVPFNADEKQEKFERHEGNDVNSNLTEVKNESKFKRKMQYFAMLSLGLMGYVNASHWAWTGPIVLQLKQSGLYSSTQITMVISAYMVGGTIGPIVAAFVGNKFGRRSIILWSIAPTLLGTFLMLYHSAIYSLIIGRFIAGFGLGLTRLIKVIYINEISSPEIRGRLNYLKKYGSTIGIFVQHVIGAYANMTINTASLFLVPLIFVLTFNFIPESPYYLMMKGREEEARNSVVKFKCTNDVEQEMKNLRAYIALQNENRGEFMSLFLDSTNRKALLISLIIVVGCGFVGGNIVYSFMHTIFNDSHTGISAYTSSIAVSACGFLNLILVASLIDSWGRRPMTITSSIGTGSCFLLLGTFFYLDSVKHPVTEYLKLAPTILLMAYSTFASFGITRLRRFVCSEVFPTNVVAKASALFDIIYLGIRLLILHFFQYFRDIQGLYSVFWILGSACLLYTLIFLFFLPETKKKTLPQINKELRNFKN